MNDDQDPNPDRSVPDNATDGNENRPAAHDDANTATESVSIENTNSEHIAGTFKRVGNPEETVAPSGLSPNSEFSGPESSSETVNPGEPSSDPKSNNASIGMVPASSGAQISLNDKAGQMLAPEHDEPKAGVEASGSAVLKMCKHSFQLIILTSFAAFALNVQLIAFFLSLKAFSGHRENLERIREKIPQAAISCPGIELSSDCLHSELLMNVQSAIEDAFPYYEVKPYPRFSLTCIPRTDGSYVAATENVLKTLSVGDLVELRNYSYPSFRMTDFREKLIQIADLRPVSSGEVWWSLEADCEKNEIAFLSAKFDAQPQWLAFQLERKFTVKLSHGDSYKTQKKMTTQDKVRTLPYYAEIKDMTPTVARSYVANQNLDDFVDRRSSVALFGTPAPSFFVTWIIILTAAVNFLVWITELNRLKGPYLATEDLWFAMVDSAWVRRLAIGLCILAPLAATVASGMSAYGEKLLTDLARFADRGDDGNINLWDWNWILLRASAVFIVLVVSFISSRKLLAVQNRSTS